MGEHADNKSGGGVILSAKKRKYAYSVMAAAAPLAIAYGIVTPDEAGLWLSLSGAVLGLGSSLALLNTPKADGE